jgi:excinuclease UvrABC nuclease subunit
MLKKFMGAVVLVLVGSIALAESVTGLITSATDKEIKATVGKKGEKKELTFTVTKDTKVKLRKSKTETDDSSIKALAEAIEKSKGSKGVVGKIEYTVTKKDDKEINTATEVTFGGKKKKAKE